jgi:hypothetical protein
MSKKTVEILRQLAIIEELAHKRGVELPDRGALAHEKAMSALRESYVNDPVGFCTTALGETLTDDTVSLLESVRDNRITIAQSANSVGKTYTAGRLAAWWYCMYPDGQVYTTAAPPEKNLKTLLWGEINTISEKHRWLFSDSKLTTMHIERDPKSFVTGVTIPQSGTEKQREAKFCASADDSFELTNGQVVNYGSLIGKTIPVVSVDAQFRRVEANAEFFDNGIAGVYEVITAAGRRLIRTAEHPLFSGRVKQQYKTARGTHKKGRYIVDEIGWTEVGSLQEDDAILVPADTGIDFGVDATDHNEIGVPSYLDSSYDGFLWDRVRSVTPIGPAQTVGVHVPLWNTYLTNVVEHNSGKHSPHLLFIVDEGDAVPDEVYRGIESCMSGSHDRLLVLMNPREERGEVYRMIRDRLASVVNMQAFDHPNVREGRDVIPGAVSREATVRRINMWTRALADGERPNEECFEVPEFLVGSVAENPEGGYFPPLPAGYRQVMEPEFWYMVLAVFPTQSEYQLISRAWVDAARVRWDTYTALYGRTPPNDVKPILGLDVAEYGVDENVACFRYGGYVAPAIVWRGMDTDAVADKATELYKQRDVSTANIDAIGIGANIAPKMRRNGCRGAMPVKVSERPTKKIKELQFTQLRDQLAWELREWLRSDTGAMLPPDELLLEELVAFTYRPTDRGTKVTKKEVIREKLKRSPNRFDALMLTFGEGRKFKLEFV